MVSVRLSALPAGIVLLLGTLPVLLLGQNTSGGSRLFDSLSTPRAAPALNTALTPEQRGDILMAHKRYREAVDVYREGGNTAVLRNKIGIAFHQQMNLPAALREYQASVKLDSHYAEAMNNVGAAYYGEKSYRRAIRAYKHALKLSPKSASVYSNLGTAYFARRDYKDASKCYETALSLDPEVFEHHNTVGTLLQERSVQERAKYHYYMAKTYAQAGMQDRALLYIRKALEEGFAERKKFLEESEFAALRSNPEFQQLIASEPRVL